MEGWSDMSTAPKDGTEVLCFEDGVMYVTSYVSFRDGFGDRYKDWISPDAGELGPSPVDPSHWMPLPAPPK